MDYEVEFKYNCFSCGVDLTCSAYHAYPGQKPDVCAYKIIAERDLKKFQDGTGSITLVDMLDAYLQKNPHLRTSE